MKKTMQDVIKDSKLFGNYFFSKETMEFWNSKVESELYDYDLFVTSEDNYNRTETLYSVRHYDWSRHEVRTIAFQKFKTKEEAIEYLKEIQEEMI